MAVCLVYVSEMLYNMLLTGHQTNIFNKTLSHWTMFVNTKYTDLNELKTKSEFYTKTVVADALWFAR